MIAHCSEISPENQERIKSIDPCVIVTDICAESSDGRIFGMEKQAGRKRLRSFYCKVAALYYSPFPETMVVDVDVAWFKSPDVVFDYVGYKATGALFFRDQISIQDPTHPPGLDRPLPDVLRLFLKSQGVAMDQSSAQNRMANESNSYSFYWRSIAGTGPYLNDYQDSSVVVMDKRSHPKTIALLKKLIELGYLGYGDKELFWLSATLANEPYVFEPFLAAHYGDCTSLILHYDPNDAHDPSTAQPLYLNAEHMIEINQLEAVGSWWRGDISRPLLVTPSTLLSSVGTAANKSIAWMDASGCSCRTYGCVRAADIITHRMAQLQWLTLSLYKHHLQQSPVKAAHDAPHHHNTTHFANMDNPSNLSNLSNVGNVGNVGSHAEGTGLCIPVAYHVSPQVMRAVDELLARPRYCAFAGCPVLAPVNLSLPWRAGDIYCDPVSFSHKHPFDLIKLAAAARQPNNTENKVEVVDGQLIKCGWDQNVYLVANQSLRDIPDWENWLKKNGNHHNEVQLQQPQGQQPHSPQSRPAGAPAGANTGANAGVNAGAIPPTSSHSPHIRTISRRLCDRLSLGPPLPADADFWHRLQIFSKQTRSSFLFYTKNKLSVDVPMA